MSVPLQIGITGGIGSGKSTVSKIFCALGVPVYDADSRAKFLTANDPLLVSKIKEVFGDNAYSADGILDRSYIAKAVFNDAEKLEVLNSLVHPEVGKDYLHWLEERSLHPYVLREAALIFETGSDKTLDKIIVVDAPEALRIARVLRRDPQRNEQQIKDIIRNQMPAAEKLRRGDFIIVNDETQLIVPQILELDRKLKKSATEI